MKNSHENRKPRRLVAGFLLILFSLLALALVHPYCLQYLADRLVVRDPLVKADLILVLAGDGNGERVDEGVKLYKAGYAPRILMSGGPLAWQLTYADWMKKQAIALGVPAAAIITQRKSRSTIEDAKYSLPLVKASGARRVILVTSSYHTGRAARVFRKLYPPVGISILVWPAPDKDFNPKRWWTRHEDLSFVVWEYVSAVLYFLKGY